ncbi:MAG: hypothetical protein SGI73_18735 [Chloroflexota bacterium]|nr:hypothetical protein [Chloroflexota bacterium]
MSFLPPSAGLNHFDARSALHLAVGMIPRDAVGLRAGLMTEALFAQIVVVILRTTLLAPPFVRLLNRGALPLDAHPTGG